MFVDPYLATITVFGGNFAPLYWAYCDGSLQSIAQNTALFALIGTTYGGDGITTFALPDFRGRYAIHQGQGPGLPMYYIGQMAGTENTTLLSINLPMHNHIAVSVTGQPRGLADAGNAASPQNAIPADITSRYALAGDGTMAPSISIVSSSIAGNNQPVSNMAPYLCMNYIICVEGIFPSRN